MNNTKLSTLSVTYARLYIFIPTLNFSLLFPNFLYQNNLKKVTTVTKYTNINI